MCGDRRGPADLVRLSAGARLRAWLSREHGNAMILMPVAILVLVLLAAITVDAAVLFLGQRRVADLAASVAQDAVAFVDEEGFYAGDLALEGPGGRPGQRADVLASQLPQDDALRSPSCEVDTSHRDDGSPLAEVRCTAHVRFVFAPAVPGAARLSEVRAQETAVGLQGG